MIYTGNINIYAGWVMLK